jgi:GDPmannose 4,6-dehydratase
VLCGNASRVKTDLGWEPTTSLEELVVMMLEADLRRLRDERV